MRRAIYYLVPFIMIAACVRGLLDVGSFQHYGLFLGFLFVVLPLDLWIGPYRGNLSEHDPAAIRQRWLFRAIIWAWAPFALALIICTLWVVAKTQPSLPHLLGFIFVTGFINGTVTVVFAHELMHRASPWERALAEAYMTLVSYPHFCQEHVIGHHAKVATPADPATARYGENLYSFVPRYVAGEFASAWRLGRKKLARRGQSPWSLRNDMLRQLLTLAILYAAIGALFGWMGVALMAGQSAVAIFMLALINYIEHYGLLRTEVSPGRYEPIGPQHSWDSSHLVTNLFLMNLGRHADHHLNARRRYQFLRHRDDSAHLPYGYPLMFLLALVPPLFFSVMNPRVRAHRAASEEASQPVGA